MDKSDIKKYIALILFGIAGILAAWVILFGLESNERHLSVSNNGSIIINGEDADNGGDAVGEIMDNGSEGDSGPESDFTESKESLLERLEKVEGLSPGPDTGYIFVGDSRFVNMNTVCGISKIDNLFSVAKVAEGYNWFNETALQQIKRITSSGLFSKWKLIICLGINDLGNCEKYVKKYESLKADYDIILVSVNPIEHYGNISNENIVKFNSALKEVDCPYIDTYDILMTTGFSTTDGLHYKEDSTKEIYNGILLGLEDMNPGTLTSQYENILDSASLSKKKSIQSDIIAQNKYVKKEPDPESMIDEELLQEFLKQLEAAEEAAEGAVGIENPEGVENPEAAEGEYRENPENGEQQNGEQQNAEQENGQQENGEQQNAEQENGGENENSGEENREEPPPEEESE